LPCPLPASYKQSAIFRRNPPSIAASRQDRTLAKITKVSKVSSVEIIFKLRYLSKAKIMYTPKGSADIALGEMIGPYSMI
jgi:hypothetical protein